MRLSGYRRRKIYVSGAKEAEEGGKTDCRVKGGAAIRDRESEKGAAAIHYGTRMNQREAKGGEGM